MKARSTLLLLLVATALGFFIFKVALLHPGTQAAAISAAYVAPFDPDKAAAIRILEGGDELAFQRQADGQTWEIVRPILDRAGRMQMQQVLSALSAIPHREIIRSPSADERSQFGVSNPKMRVKIDDASGKRIVEFLLGRETILPGGIYLGVEGRSEVYVVDAGVRDIVNQPPDDYRDRRVTALSPQAIDKIVLVNRQGQIELVRRRGEWWIDRPVSARADSALAAQIAEAASAARIFEFMDDDALTLSQVGLAEPTGTIALYEEGSDKPHLIQFGGPTESADKGKPGEMPLVFARYPERRSIYKLDAGLAGFTQLTPNRLRDRHLCRFLMDAVDRFELHPLNRPAIVFARKPESWDMVHPVAGPANSEQVMEALELLRSTKVVAFEADAARDLAAYGLDTPWLRLTVSSYVSENIPESGPGTTLLADLSFGGYDTERDGFYAMLADEPFVVVVPRSLTDQLPTSAARWQSLEIFLYDAAAIHSVAIRAGESDVEYVRGPGGVWMRDGQPVDSAVALASCVNTLAKLRATLRTDPPSEPAATPLLTVSFEAADATRHLEVFQENANGFFPATADGGQSFFFISRPDFDTLAAPLGGAPRPPAAPQPVVE